MKIRDNRGFSLVELLIIMAVLALLIAIAIPNFRGMQAEGRKAKAQGDLRTIKVAIESYYKNHGNQYPAEDNYQSTLINISPRVLEAYLYDPFGATTSTTYVYDLSTGDPATSHYYVIYSVGPACNGSVAVDNGGTVTVSNDAIWESNGYL